MPLEPLTQRLIDSATKLSEIELIKEVYKVLIHAHKNHWTGEMVIDGVKAVCDKHIMDGLNG